MLREENDQLKVDKATVLGTCDILRSKVVAAKKLEEVLKNMDAFVQLKETTRDLAGNLDAFLASD